LLAGLAGPFFPFAFFLDVPPSPYALLPAPTFSFLRPPFLAAGVGGFLGFGLGFGVGRGPFVTGILFSCFYNLLKIGEVQRLLSTLW
jgi:hypothetical protein